MEHLFTEAIFWDTNTDDIDIEKHCAYIMERVLNYGTLNDWRKLKQLYPEEKILVETQKIKNLHPKTLSFLSTYFNVPKTKFRCYEQTQSSQAHFLY